MEKKNTVLLSGSASFEIETSSVALKIKSNLSTLHLHSAAFFVGSAATCEDEKKITDDLRKKHRAYITGAITLSIASVEATINELFLESIEGNKDLFQGLPSNFHDLLSQLWETVERFAILDKYQLVLIVAAKDKFDKGEPLYQDIDSSIRLRNALVHYKPEWDTNLQEHKRLESRLKSKFKLNPFIEHTAFFPNRCLSHGCAEWVFKSCKNFIEAFYDKMGLPPKWDEKEKAFL